MPRQGDGSGDSGAYDDHEIVHGTHGDKTLQHTKHVAPMPSLEKGEALPGMNASGGAAAPLNDASEEYGATAPRHERLGEDRIEHSEQHPISNNNSSSGNNKPSGNVGGSTKSGSSHSTKDSHSHSHKESHSHATKDHSSHSSSKDHSSHPHKPNPDSDHTNDLEQIQREKAERFVNLDDEGVSHHDSNTSSHNTSKSSSEHQKGSSHHSTSKPDIDNNQDKHAKTHDASKERNTKSGTPQKSHIRADSANEKGAGHGKEHSHGEVNEYEQEARHKAEKFVNLDE